MSAEPTAEQRAVAVAIVETVAEYPPARFYPSEWDLVDTIARALAAAVTAEREKYLRVADELDGMTQGMGAVADELLAEGRRNVALMKRGQQAGVTYAARRIREVSS